MADHSPMRGRLPESPPPGRYRGPPPLDYAGVPPGPPGPHGYSSHYPYPPPSSYGPPPGYSPRGQPPYPPGHHTPYGYGYPPGGPPRGPPAPPPYHYPGYEGHYPGGAPGHPYRPGPPPRSGVPPPPGHTQRSHHQGSSPTKGASPTKSTSPKSESTIGHLMTPPADIVEVERMRAAAAAELSHDEVKPIQSDYHFFVKANLAKFKELAEQEVRKSLNPDQEMDPYLMNTNLNTRLKHAWEVLSAEEREVYASKEEEDRRRFMEEDEIASRHCATLTARGKAAKGEKEDRQGNLSAPTLSHDRESPATSKTDHPVNIKIQDDDGLSEEANSASEDSSTTNHSRPSEESPHKKSRLAEDQT